MRLVQSLPGFKFSSDSIVKTHVSNYRRFMFFLRRLSFYFTILKCFSNLVQWYEKFGYHYNHWYFVNRLSVFPRSLSPENWRNFFGHLLRGIPSNAASSPRYRCRSSLISSILVLSLPISSILVLSFDFLTVLHPSGTFVIRVSSA